MPDAMKKNSISKPTALAATLLLAVLIPCGAGDLSAQKAATLKDTFRGHFLVGAALNENQFSERDTRGAALIRAHFNSITPENALKWQSVHPEPETYDFAPGDRYVAFGETNGTDDVLQSCTRMTQKLVGQDPLDRLRLRQAMAGPTVGSRNGLADWQALAGLDMALFDWAGRHFDMPIWRLLGGTVVLEQVFQIPGVGGLLVESVFNNDRPVVMATTYMLSIAYCLMLLVTDICYTLADPRVVLK